jgi:hypothetical protein
MPCARVEFGSYTKQEPTIKTFYFLLQVGKDGEGIERCSTAKLWVSSNWNNGRRAKKRYNTEKATYL